MAGGHAKSKLKGMSLVVMRRTQEKGAGLEAGIETGGTESDDGGSPKFRAWAAGAG